MVIDETMLLRFLREADSSFPVPLSQKQPLPDFARKLAEKATVCACCRDGRIVSAVIGYTRNVTGELAYISVVATLPEARGRGLAPGLIKEFIAQCRQAGLRGVHLYTDPTNTAAIKMYETLGFVPYAPETETRPGDIHLIFCC